MKFSLVLCMVLAMANASSAQNPEIAADVIFINGNIYTGVPDFSADGVLSERAAGDRMWTQAIAVQAGRILWTGLNEGASRFKGPTTEVVDLGGHYVLPGFNDAHTHLASAGLEKLNVDLVGAKSLAEMKQRISAHARSAASGEWLQGGGWDSTLWADQTLPTRQDMDAVTGDHPAIFSRVDGHISVANTAALKAAEISAQTPDPHGGKIDHDANGNLTGILRETARESVSAKIPPPTVAQRRRAAELALEDAARWGVTSAQDNSQWEDFLTYEQLEKEGKLTLRISEWLPFDAPVEKLKEMRAHHPADDPMLHTAMLKGFMDGSLGSRTAALLAPYSDDPKNSGLPRYEPDALNKKTAERLQAGFQIGFHAIGDRGNDMALDAFRYALQTIPAKRPSSFRLRIEHAQVVAPEDFQRYQDLKVIASMQPNHLLTDMNWAESRLGAERAKHSYAWKEFLDHGVVLAFGTDYPVEPITPFRGLYAALTRKNEAGIKEYFPEQRITIHQAIAAYTTGSAFAQFAEREKGLLAPGMLADFVVLDRDITKVAPSEILRTRVLRTVVGGKTVYAAK
ncbi:MAG TPA: amidohydrolase [Verrucomicrobiae bacterium]|jgi:predicted amidohydrolase YtcJ|nr:amidohydrolase [Verrucomicrobiae bacterium]